MNLTHGGLFEGIGGFSLAAQWAGFETKWMVENNKWCTKLLNKRFPHAKKYGDIKETRDLPAVDVITGGFPCQPFSVAGKRKGAEDDRALWPEMLRIIKESKPAWVIGENVTGIINMELDTVLSDLEGEGFEAIPFVIPACGINAWHRRNRVWILAYSDSNRKLSRPGKIPKKDGKISEWNKDSFTDYSGDNAGKRVTSNTGGMAAGAINGGIFGKAEEAEREKDQRERLRNGFEHVCKVLADSYGVRTQIPVTGGFTAKQQSKRNNAKGIGDIWQAEPGVGRVVHGLPGRVDRLRGLGNAIVPEIAYIFFMLIKEIEEQLAMNNE